ncbi:hypothetical protein AB1Y20_014146 [Prymnesium parvum]|uniref:J domain-containing protein n=1 Tax=Prymnesium parvum TaxID=97485 RepID=A0AB34ICV9_PRYPA
MAASKAKDEGNVAFRKKDYAEAVQCFTRSLTLNAKDHTVLGNRSAALASLERFEESLADAIAAVAIEPKYVKGYYRQATALLALQRYREAITAAKKGLQLDPNNAQMRELLLRAEEEVKKLEEGGGGEEEEEEESDGDDASEPMEAEPAAAAAPSAADRAAACKDAGNGKYKAGEYAKAVELYGQAIELAPDNPTYLMNRSAALLALNKSAAALSDAKAALELDPTLLKAHLRAAKCLIQMGQLSDVRRQLEAAQALPGGAAATAAEFATLEQLDGLLRNGKKALELGTEQSAREATILFSQLAERCPDSVQFVCLHMEAILIARPKQGAPQVISESSRWLRLNQDNPDLLCVRGKALYGTGQLEQALKHFGEALRLDPDHSGSRQMRSLLKELDGLKTRGNEAFASGRYQEAIERYTDAIAVDEKAEDIHLTLYTNRATAKFKLKDYAGAINDCNAALRIQPRHVKAVLRRAAAKLELEDYKGAIADYEEAQQISPEDKSIAQGLRHAKIELKKSQRKDLYKLLGTTKHASDQEIKKAYRKSALQYHPDRHSNATEEEREAAEKKFKEIGEAFDILSTPEKKEKYDQGLDVDEINGNGGGGHGHGGMGGMDPMDIFQMFNGGGGMPHGFGGGMPQGYPRRPRHGGF